MASTANNALRSEGFVDMEIRQVYRAILHLRLILVDTDFGHWMSSQSGG